MNFKLFTLNINKNLAFNLIIKLNYNNLNNE
jgi:hypothetical protein